MSEQRLAEMRDANIMLARTQARLRDATPAEVQRHVMRIESETYDIAEANERQNDYWQRVGGRTDGVTEAVGFNERMELAWREKEKVK